MDRSNEIKNLIHDMFFSSVEEDLEFHYAIEVYESGLPGEDFSSENYNIIINYEFENIYVTSKDNNNTSWTYFFDDIDNGQILGYFDYSSNDYNKYHEYNSEGWNNFIKYENEVVLFLKICENYFHCETNKRRIITEDYKRIEITSFCKTHIVNDTFIINDIISIYKNQTSEDIINFQKKFKKISQ